jgi:hypothetical protein
METKNACHARTIPCARPAVIGDDHGTVSVGATDEHDLLNEHLAEPERTTPEWTK